MSVRKSIVISALSANSLTVIGIGASMVIARLLTPADLGAYAIAAVLVGIAHQFRDFGTSAYLVQCQVVDAQSLGKAFGLTLLTAAALGLMVLAAAPFAASFYRSPDIGGVLAVLGLNFFIVPFGAITLALLRREMRFKERAIIDHASAITGLVVAITCALLGYGALSLAIGTLSSTIATTLCASYYRPKAYPWSVTFRGLGEVANFGASMTAGTLITQVNRGVIEMMGGRFVGLEAVGLYNKAKSVTDQIGSLLLGVASQVTLPMLSSAHRKGEDIAPLYLRALALLTGVVWPACAFAAIFPVEILHFMYGPQWGIAAPMLRLMSLVALFGSPFWIWSQPMLALGRPKPVVLGEALHLLSLVGSMVVLVLLGSENLALAAAFGTPLVLVYVYVTVRKALGYSHSAYFAALAPSLYTCALVVIFALLASALTQQWHEALRLAACGLGSLVVWTMAILLSKHVLAKEMRLMIVHFRK